MINLIEESYTGTHKHPIKPCWVEVVAYERVDGSWDVLIFEPKGAIPELESSRINDDYIFYTNIKSIQALENCTDDIHKRLGSGYEPILFFKEVGSRKWLGRIYDHLLKLGRSGVVIHESAPNEWEIYVRRKDFSAAEEVIATNVSGTQKTI